MQWLDASVWLITLNFPDTLNVFTFLRCISSVSFKIRVESIFVRITTPLL